MKNEDLRMKNMEDNKLDIKAFLDRDEQKDLLRFLTAGSVDDGKSTLIGRLLFDSKKIYEDQLDALERDSKRVGNAGDHIDYALLLDGLKAEREQGITIDVAYRYFSTNKRKFIIADTPGHEQYTRNMITGGSTANLAVILVDARLGVITQTRRHTFLVSLLGIKHVVLAVNKMDLVDFSEERFNEIVAEYRSFIEPLGVSDVVCIPLADTEISSGQLVILQAFQAGKPVIVTRNSSAHDYINDGIDGFIIEKTKAALIAKLDLLDSNPTLYKEMSANALRAFMENYTSRKMGERLFSAISLNPPTPRK